jgi:hypothetical protein
MTNAQIVAKLRGEEEILSTRYSKLSKLFIFLSLFLLIWIIILFIGIVFEYGHTWAALSFNGWILFVSILFVIFIILELVFYFHFSSVFEKRIKLEKPKPEFINGKKVYIFTYPEGMDGGIFSKTYIQIDENTVLRLRNLMIPPEDLWQKK